MDIYVVPKPFSHRKQNVIGCDLRYHPGLTNSYGGIDGAEASLAIIRNTFLFWGERIVPQPSQAFINLTNIQSALHALQLMAVAERGRCSLRKGIDNGGVKEPMQWNQR